MLGSALLIVKKITTRNLIPEYLSCGGLIGAINVILEKKQYAVQKEKRCYLFTILLCSGNNN